MSLSSWLSSDIVFVLVLVLMAVFIGALVGLFTYDRLTYRRDFRSWEERHRTLREVPKTKGSEHHGVSQ